MRLPFSYRRCFFTILFSLCLLEGVGISSGQEVSRNNAGKLKIVGEFISGMIGGAIGACTVLPLLHLEQELVDFRYSTWEEALPLIFLTGTAGYYLGTAGGVYLSGGGRDVGSFLSAIAGSVIGMLGSSLSFFPLLFLPTEASEVCIFIPFIASSAGAVIGFNLYQTNGASYRLKQVIER